MSADAPRRSPRLQRQNLPAPATAPATATAYPEPIRIPRTLRLLVAEKVAQLSAHIKTGHDWTTLRDSPLGDEILDVLRQISSMNPDLPEPRVFRVSHISHTMLWYMLQTANNLVSSMAEWKSGEMSQNDCMPLIKEYSRTLSDLTKCASAYDV
jgi:hypothetical protein